MNIWDSLPRPFFVLAPMDDVTDTVFRQIVAECTRPDLFMTEFVNADGLQSPGRQALLKKLQFSAAEQPIIAQLWGKVPDNYFTTAQELVDRGFAGIDINMGCPDKTVLKNGCSIALCNNRALAERIIAALKRGASGRLPVSVKTRLGLNHVDLSWHEFLLHQGLDALIIHGRTAKQLSDVPADWNMIAKICELRDKISPSTVIVGNGDVLNRQQGLNYVQQFGVEGVMIGRGIFRDPFVFAADSPWSNFTKEQRIKLYRRHIQLFAQAWPVGEHKLHTLNKFCKIYINGFDGAKELRDRCMQTKTIQELLVCLS